MASNDFHINLEKNIWGRPKLNTPLFFLKIGEIMNINKQTRNFLVNDYHSLFPRISPSATEEEKDQIANIPPEMFKRIDPLERNLFVDWRDSSKFSSQLLIEDRTNNPFFSFLINLIYNSKGFFQKDEKLFDLFVDEKIIIPLETEIVLCKECLKDSKNPVFFKGEGLDCPHEKKRII